DDQQIIRAGVESILNGLPNAKVVGQAANRNQAFNFLKSNEVDLVFMDIHLGEESGITLTKELLFKYPEIKVIALTISESIALFNDMIAAGASGFLLKNVKEAELESAITAVMEGDNYFSKEYLALVKPKDFVKTKSKIQLSDREKEVLGLICSGNSNNEIADELNISVYTADQHRRNLLLKIGAKNTAQLVMIAFKEGFVN
ncbi:MAG TPA: response regulator transcription factor, partial [Bacteroidales bacterium]